MAAAVAFKATSSFRMDRLAVESALWGPDVERAIEQTAERVAEDAQAVQVRAAGQSPDLSREGDTVAELTRAKGIVFWTSVSAGRELRRVVGGGAVTVPVALVVSDSAVAGLWEYGVGRTLGAAMRTAALRSGARYVPLVEEDR